jgi:hypothetical protein
LWLVGDGTPTKGILRLVFFSKAVKWLVGGGTLTKGFLRLVFFKSNEVFVGEGTLTKWKTGPI